MHSLPAIVRVLLCLTLVTLTGCGNSDTSQTPGASTETKAWIEAAPVSNPGFAPVVAGGNGIILAAWKGVDGVYASQASPESGWTTPRKVIDRPDAYYGNLKLTMNSHGEGVLLWHTPYADGSATPYGILICRFHGGTGWDAPQTLQNDDNYWGFYSDVDITLGDDDTAYFAAILNHGKVVYAIAQPGKAWSAPHEVQEDSLFLSNVREPHVAVDASGGVHLVWIGPYINADGFLTDYLVVHANHFTKGAGWSPPRIISTPNIGLGGLSIAADGNGNAIAAWREWDNVSGGSFSRLCSSRYIPIGGWRIPIILSDQGHDEVMPVLTMNRNGNGCLTWIRITKTSTFELCSRRFSAGSWEPLVSGGVIQEPHNLKVVAGSGKEFIASWYQFVYPTDDPANWTISVYGGRLKDGMRWDKTLLKDGIKKYFTGPELASDGLGNAVAVWMQESGTPETLSNAVFASKYQ